MSVTPDGRHLIVSDGSSVTMLALDGSGQTPLLTTPGRSRGDGAVSPDGRWLAYVEVDGMLADVFVSPLAAPDQSRVPISSGGGVQPRWSPDGRELFYLGPDGLLMRVDVVAGDAFSAGRPQRVLDRAYFRGRGLSQGGSYDVARDGRRFLMVKDEAQDEQQARIVVVRHWIEELRRLVPVPER
jgi:serine/threonine-protein kinase